MKYALASKNACPKLKRSEREHGQGVWEKQGLIGQFEYMMIMTCHIFGAIVSLSFITSASFNIRVAYLSYIKVKFL